jgi:hypothetical protein
MKSVLRLIVLLLLVVGWGLAALSLHVVVTPDQIPVTLVTKDQFGLIDTYVDTRAWTMDDVGQHPALVQKLLRSERADVLRHVVGGDRKSSEIASRLSDALHRAAKSEDGKSRSTQPTTAEQTVRAVLGWMR